MEALEKYYREYLLGYASDANWEIYDVDMQMTKDHVERILEIGYIEDSSGVIIQPLWHRKKMAVKVPNFLYFYWCHILVS